MGPSVDAKLDKPSTTVGLNDPAQSAEDSVDAAIVQTLMALNPVAGLTLVAFNNITKSDPVSNPVFRSGTDDNGLFGLGNFSLVEDRLANASQAKAAGNDAEFKKFSEQALNEARLLPNGDSLAVPMVEADLLALDGKFEEASKKYKAVEASLKAIPSCNGELSDAIEGVKKRHRGVLAAGVATGALTFAKAQKEGDGTAMLDAQRLATSCADELYLMNPSEKTLQMLVAAYKQVGLDLRGIRTQIGQNKAKISEEFNKLTGFIPTGPVAEPIDPNKYLDGFGFPTVNLPDPSIDIPTPAPIDPIKELEEKNKAGQDLISRTEAHFRDLIAQAHPEDTYQQHIEAATAFAIGGNHHAALDELQKARHQFKVGPVVVPSTAENMGKEITILHRIVGVSGISYDLHDEVLKEARDFIKHLKEEHPDQAALFTVENMELQATVNSDRGALHIGSPDNSDDENEAAANRYHDGVRKGQTDIADFCEKALKDVKDPATREALGARMFQARAAALELDLGRALTFHEQDKKDAAATYASASLKEFNDFAAKYKDVPNAAGYAEGMGRARLAEGYYQFRTGKIEESIATLKAIKKDYPESTASLKVSGRGYWPNEVGIVDGDGNITDTDKEDVMAAITTAASKLNKEKGRGLMACGIGAGLFIAADLALGEKVSGVAVASACVAGYVVDRALLIAESSNEIAASYRTGVSTATVGDA
ncbi:MAG TPA: hypothetical protein VFX30_05435, partial [bacterium]|nr:hypothetical protein [bacterium]